MAYCPNKSHPDWKALIEAKVPNPYTIWNKYKGNIPAEFLSDKTIDKEKVNRWTRDLFGQDVNFYDIASNIGNKTIHGYVANGAINMWSSAEVGTEFHEGYHLLFRTMLSDAQRSLLYAEATREFGKPTVSEIEEIKKQFPEISEDEAYNLVLEEKMAENFREYMLTDSKSGKTLGEKIRNWFKDLLNWIKAIISDDLSLKQVYSLMKSTKVNQSFMGRKVLRNPENMVSSINPTRYVAGIPSTDVDAVVSGLADMVIDTIDSYKEDADIGKILGNTKTNGSIVNGLLYQLYEFKDKRPRTKETTKILSMAFQIESSYKNYLIGFKNTGKAEYKQKADELAKSLKDYRKANGIGMKNYPPITATMSPKDRAAAEELRLKRETIQHVITNWNGKYDAKTGNELVPSWRDLVEKELTEYGYVVRSKKLILEDEADSDLESKELESQTGVQEKIYDANHFQQSPAKKLSKKAKMILRRIPLLEAIEENGQIRYRELKNKFFGNIPKYHEPEFVYKQLTEIFTEATTFEEMLAKLNSYAQHRVDYKPIARKLNNLKDSDRATMFNAFAMKTNTFTIVQTGVVNTVYNSNSATTEAKAIKNWRNTAIEVGGQVEADSITRAVYVKTIVDETDVNDASSTLAVKAKKLQEIKEAYKEVFELSTKRSTTENSFISKDSNPTIAAVVLGKLVWDLGMSIGVDTSVEDSVRNIQSLLDKGLYVKGKKKTELIKGKALFTHIVEQGKFFRIVESMTTLTRAGNTIQFGEARKNVVSFHDTEKSGVKFLAELSAMFISRSAQSFVSAMKKQTYPVQARTPLDDVIIDLKTDIIKNGKNGLQLFRGDKFHMSEEVGPTILLKHLLNNPEYVDEMHSTVLDAVKHNDEDGIDIEQFNIADNFISRLSYFSSKAETGYFYCMVPAQADRTRIDAILMPRLRGHANSALNYTNGDIFEMKILEDLLRIKQAREVSEDPNAEKILGYHTGAKLGLDGSGKFMQFSCLDKNGNWIVQDKELSTTKVVKNMSYYVSEYIAAKKGGVALTKELRQFETELNNMKVGLTKFYNDRAVEIAKYLIEQGRALEISKSAIKSWEEKFPKGEKVTQELRMRGLIKDFLIHEDVMVSEIIKVTRGSRAQFSSNEAFTKRQRVLTTPGNLMAIKGTLGNQSMQDDAYGMMPVFHEVTFLDLRLDASTVIKKNADEYVNRTMESLQKLGINGSFMENYRPGKYEETDGLSIVSLEMYRSMAEGKGLWGDEEEQAYKNYVAGGDFVYQEGFTPKGLKPGSPVIITPLKPYFENLTAVSGTLASEIQKNAYFPALRGYTENFPLLDDIRNRMELTGPYAGLGLEKVHVFNALSTKKSLKTTPYDLTVHYDAEGNYIPGNMIELPIKKHDSRKLRFPQEIPMPKNSDETVFNRQSKKNAIANVEDSPLYYYNAGLEQSQEVSGKDLKSIYHRAIEEKLNRDFKTASKELGVEKFYQVVEKLKGETAVKGKVNVKAITRAEEFKQAKLEFLQKIRDIIARQLNEREMSHNFLDALNITIDPVTAIPRFTIPADYPVFGKKFQSALLSIYNNNVFKQKMPGTEAVQTAALGGFETNDTLKFLEIVEDPNNRASGVRLAHAEVLMRADVLRKFNIEPGEFTLDSIPEELRRLLGYRIPNQDKASMIILKIKGLLPENYGKAIVVPPQLIKLMGSDFDVDKMFLLFPEIEMVDGQPRKVQVDYNTLALDTDSVSKLSDKQINTVLYDTIEAVLSSSNHFQETLSPLDTDTLQNIANQLLEVNPEIESTQEFCGGWYHANSYVRNQLGNALRGNYANMIAGRNVAIHLEMNLFDSFAVKITGQPINTSFLSTVPDVEYIYEEDRGLPTDKVGTRYLSAAVDASKNPFHYIINDSQLTYPITALWVHYHGDTQLLHFFLNQPIVRRLVDIMSEKYNNDLSKMNLAYKKVMEEFALEESGLPANYKKIQKTVAMSKEDILSLSVSPYKALTNFMKFHAAGRQLAEAFKVLTPDTMDGLTRVEAMQAYVDRMNKFTNPVEGEIDNMPVAFYGRTQSENIVTQMLSKDSAYGLERGYYNLILKTLGVSSAFIPITMSAEVAKFKQAIKTLVGKSALSSEQHRDINSAIMFLLLTKEDSPMRVYLDKPYSDEQYTPKKESFTLWTQIQRLRKKYPQLNANEFLTKLEESSSNQDTRNFKTFNFDASLSYTTNEKDRIIDDLTNLLYRPEAYLAKLPRTANEKEREDYKNSINEIKSVAFKLAVHTFVSHGFKQNAFNFAELVPPRFLTQPMDRTAAELKPISIANYIHEQGQLIEQGNYFSGEDLLNFFRIFGEMRPGGRNLVDRENFENVLKLKPSITISIEKYGGIAPKVLVFRTNKESGVYMLDESTSGNSTKKATYVNIKKTSNNNMHIVGGDFLRKKSVGDKQDASIVKESLQIIFDNTSNEVAKPDVAQLCMLS